MRRQTLRRVLTLALLGSLAVTLWNGWQILHGWPGSALAERSAEQIAAAMDRLLARAATADRLTERLDALLARDERSWIEIDAVLAVSRERGIALPAATLAALEAARQADAGPLAFAAHCAACAWDASRCRIDATLLCQATVAVTPLADLAGIARESGQLARGEEVDRLDLGLSIIGLSATALALPTGGSAALVAAGAKALKMLHRMGRLSPRMTRMLREALDEVVNWQAAGALRPADLLRPAHLTGLVRRDAFGPVAALVTDMGLTAQRSGFGAAVAIMPRIESAAEAGPRRRSKGQRLAASRCSARRVFCARRCGCQTILWHFAQGSWRFSARPRR